MVGQGINEGSYFRRLMTGGWIEGMNTDIRKYVVRQHGNRPAVSNGILDDKVRHRAVRPAPRVSACDGGCRSVRAPPVGAGHRPPLIGPDITFAGFLTSVTSPVAATSCAKSRFVTSIASMRKGATVTRHSVSFASPYASPSVNVPPDRSRLSAARTERSVRRARQIIAAHGLALEKFIVRCTT